MKAVRLVKNAPKPEPPPRWNIRRAPVDFGPAVTDGAFRCERTKGEILLTPLPDTDPFGVALRADVLTGEKGVRIESVVAVGMDGRAGRTVPFRMEGGLLKFQTRKDEFAYRVLPAQGGGEARDGKDNR